jgi:hypothetical protein
MRFLITGAIAHSILVAIDLSYIINVKQDCWLDLLGDFYLDQTVVSLIH